MTVLLNGFDLSDTADWWGWSITGPGRMSGHVAVASREDFFTEVAEARASVGPVTWLHGGFGGLTQRRRAIGPKQHWMADTSTGVIHVWNSTVPGYTYRGDDDRMALHWCCFSTGELETEFPTCTRWYVSLTGSGLTTSPANDAAWDNGSAPAASLLTTSPASSRNGFGDATTRDDTVLAQLAVPLDATTAAVIAAGGATVRGQFRARARSGIGISEASQDLISQMGIRVTAGNSTTIRGTALALHGLGSSGGSAKWAAQSTHVNRAFPPAAASNVLSAVAGAAAGDFLVVEVGYRNFTPDPPAATGGGIYINDTAASDLPEDEATTDNLNSWIEICG